MIVFPMAGLSSRFFKAGYKEPKYKLPIYGKSVLHAVLGGFEKYFNDQKIVFVLVDNEFKPESFVRSVIESFNIKNYEIVTLSENTRGQAETVYLGLKKLGISASEPVTIFNVDTFRPNFEFPKFYPCSYLETFIGSGKNWSNVVPVSEGSDVVAQATEKQESSKYCCTGLYHWENAQIFNEAYLQYENEMPDKELYVAPMYNYAIQNKKTVKFTVIDTKDVIFCGTPDEYESLLK
jgi:2-C-methyl-D-erythritol 4-phosphate cytidylyltransferase